MSGLQYSIHRKSENNPRVPGGD